MENENKNASPVGLTPEQEQSIKNHQTNLIAYSATTLFGVLMATVLIPNFVRLKKNADFGPEKFPYIVAGLFIFLGIIGIVLEIVNARKEGVNIPLPKLQLKQYIPQAILILSGFVFIGVASVLGFLIASVIFMAFWLFLYGSNRLKINIIWALVYGVLIYLLFSQVLGIRFTGGILGF
ncbi:tripartite tricarboxylate transporter TctB family protein [Pseudoflavonifractor sp. 60]|uniref:tripartite tricarboxylate transporter TctB family protein n=1 Tax=Pseudoflavonifractor sp. 60 TaxID=2304576 RepID=UPI00136C1B72|nr:tripartite tricarboxylate transporter TctB family protein [Pseudoflavonifractor sp. 60]NBI68506.1 tripartite tricarboxylate transporter TctB family protein [Pseudoflavonifractor sp. 60]